MMKLKFYLKRNKILIILGFLFVYFFYLGPDDDDDGRFQEDDSSTIKGKYYPYSAKPKQISLNNGANGVLPCAKERPRLMINNSIAMPPKSGVGLTSEHIPKKIWSYWHSATPPQFIQDCLAGWQRNNPSHSVYLLTPENLRGFIHTRPPHIFEIMNSADQSAWVRLAILAQEGGIWMDPSMIVTRSINFIHAKQQSLQSEGVLFFMDHFVVEPAHPFFEKFMIAAVPGAKFIQMWFKEWTFVISDFNGGDDYLTHLQKTYGISTFHKLIQACDTPSDFLQEVALLKVLRIDGIPYPPGLSAVKHSYGPLSALEAKDWSSWEFVGSLFLPIGETELVREDKVPHLIYLTPYQIQIIDWMGYLSTRVYHQMNHQSFFCLHIQGDPIDCGGKRYFSDEVCDDPIAVKS